MRSSRPGEAEVVEARPRGPVRIPERQQWEAGGPRGVVVRLPVCSDHVGPGRRPSRAGMAPRGQGPLLVVETGRESRRLEEATVGAWST